MLILQQNIILMITMLLMNQSPIIWMWVLCLNTTFLSISLSFQLPFLPILSIQQNLCGSVTLACSSFLFLLHAISLLQVLFIQKDYNAFSTDVTTAKEASCSVLEVAYLVGSGNCCGENSKQSFWIHWHVPSLNSSMSFCSFRKSS